MQISGVLHGAHLLEFTGFAATEVVGLSEVSQIGDPSLAGATAVVPGKVAAALPFARQQPRRHAVSQVHRFEDRYPALPDMWLIRTWCCARSD